jgi:hypothetical protein
MKSLMNLMFGTKKEIALGQSEKESFAPPVKSEWIFVDKGNYLVKCLPFSL